MTALRHLPSPLSSGFSEAVRIDAQGGWIFLAGQVGVAIPADNGPLSFEEETRAVFRRLAHSLEALDAGLEAIVSLRVFLTDLSLYGAFGRVRGEFFAKNPPASTAVGVNALLLNARIEIEGIAFITR